MSISVSQARVAEAIGNLERLVGFDTTSHRSNLNLMHWVSDTLKEFGARVTLLPSPDRTKANLFATFGPASDGGLVYSGHTDVVPAKAADWQSDPFQLVQRGTRLHGRGSCDMKGSIACALTFANRLGLKTLPIPVHFALSYDEELGCLGVPGIVSEFGRSLPMPALTIVGEPTSMKPITAHKGYRTFETKVTGVPAHSSRPADGVSAIRIATAFLSALENLADELSTDVNIPDMVPPFSTINVGKIDGGSATNVVAPHCLLMWELRPVPGSNVEAILERLKQLVTQVLPEDLSVGDTLSRIETQQTAFEPFYSATSGPALNLVHELTGLAKGKSESYGSEAGFFQDVGVPTIIIGPGEVLQAHKIDEYIEIDQIAQSLAFYDRLESRLFNNGLDGL